ncbi:MAG: hypothetical protein J7M40_20060, partial [Planctomycetes bacterium]|nr:hypothetical protein [Planctomycetota bacterium]
MNKTESRETQRAFPIWRIKEITWPSEKTTHTCEGKLANSVGKTVPNIPWQYRVPSGTNQWTSIGGTGP